MSFDIWCSYVCMLCYIQDQICAHVETYGRLKRVSRYVQGSLDYCCSEIVGYADSEWAGDRLNRKSTSGYVFTICNCSVSWFSRKQSTVVIIIYRSWIRSFKLSCKWCIPWFQSRETNRMCQNFWRHYLLIFYNG